jgi:hypothetical protein
MPTFYEYEMEDGTTLLVEGPEPARATGVTRGISNKEDQLVKIKARLNFSDAFKDAKSQAQALLKEIRELNVSEAEIKFGLSTVGELGVFAVGKIGVGLNYEITLRWKREETQ